MLLISSKSTSITLLERIFFLRLMPILVNLPVSLSNSASTILPTSFALESKTNIPKNSLIFIFKPRYFLSSYKRFYINQIIINLLYRFKIYKYI